MGSFLTDRKRALGLGSGRHGTSHFWTMIVSSLLMCVAVPAFVITFVIGFGRSHAEVMTYYSHPIPALVMALSLFVIIRHAMFETLEAVEDYVHGTAGKLLQVAVTAFSYTMIAVGVFALARLAI
ncbi:MAG: succinate dehydrogenase, hydrophobic membrane anchor protein [Pseudomonadota bacterium]